MQATFPALCRPSQDTQSHQHLGEGSRSGMGAAGIAWMMAEVTLPTRSCSHRCRQPWHQHHPSDSLDLLELPQGPALFTECLEWRLPLPLRSRSFGEPCP